jgi:hypothetical protein
MTYLSMFGGTLKNHSVSHLEQRQLGTYVTRSRAVSTNITARGMLASFPQSSPSGPIDQFS